MSTRIDGTPRGRLIRRSVLLAVAASTFLVLSWASGSDTKGVQPNQVEARNQNREAATAATANFANAPTVSPAAREFVQSRSDSSRSVELALIVIPLMLILLAEGELLSVGGRAKGRVLVAFGLPLSAVFAVLAYARIRDYIG